MNMSQMNTPNQQAWTEGQERAWQALELGPRWRSRTVTELESAPVAESFAVLAAGDPSAALMLIGASDLADDDQTGEPFSGACGPLLRALLFSIGLKFESDVYRVGASMNRSAADLSPTSPQFAQCTAQLVARIEQAQPTVVVLLGEFALLAVLKAAVSSTLDFARKRTRLHDTKWGKYSSAFG
jgi:uracil-DNA glycosylase family 4